MSVVKRKSINVLPFAAFPACSCGVCGLLLLSGWKERWFGGEWLREREEKCGKPKNKATTHFDGLTFPLFFSRANSHKRIHNNTRAQGAAVWAIQRHETWRYQNRTVSDEMKVSFLFWHLFILFSTFMFEIHCC